MSVLYVIVNLSTATLSSAEKVICGLSTEKGPLVSTETFGTFGAIVSTTYHDSVSLHVFPEVSSALIMRVHEVSIEIVQFTVVAHD